MRGLISLYLDVLRFIAALGVFLSHAEQHSGLSGIVPGMGFRHFDHKFVIIFFVISGYVIAASASRPDRTLANYSADRLARLSSVVIPALVLTYALDAIGSMVSPSIYSFIDPHWQSVRLLINLLYCQQIWFLSVNPSSNTALWSLGYEFWYYVLFGIWIFIESKAAKILLFLAAAAFVGPKILLLMPAWGVGAAAFYATKAWNSSFRSSAILFAVTGCVAIAALVFEDQLGFSNGKAGLPPLYYSSNFAGDNLFAVVVAIHFLCCGLFSKHLVKDLEALKTVKFIRWLAGHTFSLYAYHMPLLFFVLAVVRYDTRNPFAVVSAMCVVLLIIAGLSKVTEEQYPVLRSFLRRSFGSFAGSAAPLASK
jgi:peptidoglycan/LPS O-acetylase OafA/YrhL